MKKTYNLHHLVAAIFLSLSVGILIFSTWCGIGLTYDSYDYLAAASSIVKGAMLRNAQGNAYLFHAPLYPVFISLLGSNPVAKVRFFNIVFFITSIAIIYLANYKYFHNKWLSSLSILFLGLSVGQQMIYNFLWTEPLFLFLFAAHNFSLVRFIDSGKRKSLLWFVIFGFLLGLTRNSGFFIILSTSWIMLIFQNKNWHNAILYFLFSSLGFIVWNIYVLTAHDAAMESVYFSNEFFSGIWENTIHYLDIISLWILPSIVPFIFRLFILLSCILYIIYAQWNIRNSKPALAYFIQFAVYVFIMSILIKVDVDEIERLLSVVYPGLIVGLFLLIDQRWGKYNITIKKSVIICLIFWMTYSGIRTIHNASMWYTNQCSNYEQ